MGRMRPTFISESIFLCLAYAMGVGDSGAPDGNCQFIQVFVVNAEAFMPEYQIP